MKKAILFFIFFLALGFVNEADAQCRGYARKECRPTLGDFIHDGKMNVAQLYPGDKAEIALTFFQGQEYRILVCLGDFEGKGEFTIYDLDRNEIFSSESSDDDYFDFKVGATQQLLVEIKIDNIDETTHDLDHTSCIAVMVGLK